MSARPSSNPAAFEGGARRGAHRAGLTLLELLLALSITAIMGVAVASMLTMVSTVAQSDREGRSVLLRAHAAQARLRAYIDPSLCVLQHDAANQTLCVWLADQAGPESVNLTEIRVLWFDPTGRTIDVERVQFPAAWPEISRQAADVIVPVGTDYIAAVLAQRALGFTVRQTVVSNVWSAGWGFNTGKGAPPSDATRATLSTLLGIDSAKAVSMLHAFGIPNRKVPAK